MEEGSLQRGEQERREEGRVCEERLGAAEREGALPTGLV